MVDFAKLIQQKREQHNIEMKPQSNTRVIISIAGADYAIKYPRDDRLTEALKNAVPPGERNWHRTQYVWLVSPDEIENAIKVLSQHTSQTITLPEAKPSTPQVMEKTFQLDYLGATKDRGKRKSAYGSVNGDWASEFPEDVLKNFFEGRETSQSPSGLQTLYQVLCVVESVEPEQIRKAYKRLALQWHPDTCREEDAHERFIQINEAYKILIDPEQRKRYDAGLYFERQADHEQERAEARARFHQHKFGYRAPLRCGQITAKGTVRLMRFVVSEILKWDDVIDAQGRVMTSSWPKGSDRFVTEWLTNQTPF